MSYWLVFYRYSDLAFIHLLTTAERKNYAVEVIRHQSVSREGTFKQDVCGEAVKLGRILAFFQEWYFLQKMDTYQKEGGDFETCRKMSQFL